MSDSILAVALAISIAIIVWIVASEIQGEQATCTTKKLTNSSFIVCTYKNKILYSGEVKNE